MIPHQASAFPSVPPAAVREELELVLASRVFARSDRMCRFLRFVVEETLSGRGEGLKETYIGVRVFDRPVSYNPATDPVVRVEARRLRSKLREYYGENGGAQAVIDLPKGAYAPVFHLAPSAPVRRRGRRLRIAILAGVALAAGGVLFWTFGGRTAPRVPSVAVLPIIDLSPDKSLQYFCDGLTEQLIFSLSSIDGMRVPGRTSSFQFKGKNADLRTIGRELGVGHILEGSVRAAGERLRITLQLIGVDDGYHLWSQTYERDLRDVFALQDEIGRALINALAFRVAGSKRMQNRRFSDHSEALKLYFEGRHFWFEGDFDKAIALTQRAIQKDPGFALAYAALARAYTRLEAQSFQPRVASFPQAKAAAKRALEIDGSLVEAVVALAVIHVYEWEWEQAAREFERALALDPHSAQAHGEYAIGYLAAVGRLEEAVRESAKSVELEPLAVVENNRHGIVLRFAGRNAEAIAQMQKTVAMAPESPGPRNNLGRAYLQSRMFDRALKEFEGDSLWTAITLAKAGRREEALRVRLTQRLRPVDWAAYHTALNDKDRAFQSLEAALLDRSSLLLQVASDPFWNLLRGDERYRRLRKRMGLNQIL